MITNDTELEAKINNLNVLIQEVQNYIGPDDPEKYEERKYKIRFPRSYIRSAITFRSKLGFIKDAVIKNNIAYTLIQTDLFCWLLNRTDLIGTLREMIIKSCIIKMSSIAETCAMHATDKKIGKDVSFEKRCKRMTKAGIIDEELKDNLIWLWRTRKAIHIYLLDYTEYKKYKDSDYDKAVITTRTLVQKLNEFYE